MSRIYWFLIDGDRVSELFDAAAAIDDVDQYMRAHDIVEDARKLLTDRLRIQGATVLMSAADEILGFSVEPIDWKLIQSPEDSLVHWSVGTGPSMRAAHGALAVAKATGRGRTIAFKWDPVADTP